MMTESEMEFERFCKQANINIKRIKEESTPTPDYKLNDWFIEIKEIEYIEPKKTYSEDKSTWWYDTQSREPGKNVRHAMKSAEHQFDKSKNTNSNILVIFDKNSTILDYDIYVAMNGFETVQFPSGNMKFGSSRKCTPNMGTRFSAISYLYNDTWILIHNLNAKVPCKISFTNNHIKHFKCEGIRKFVEILPQ